jgi:hypothetical protein
MALLREKTMKAFLFIAAVGMATSIFVQSVSAQNLDDAAAAQTAMEKAVTEMGVQSKPPSAAAYDKADAAMTTPNSLPTEADRKASAAMSKK